MLFGWSISKNFTTNNISNQIEIKSEDPKIKLFENEKSRTLRVAILNGCGEPGLAAKFSDLLRKKQVDVVRSENADHFEYEKTILIQRNENVEGMRYVADALGFDIENNEHIITSIDPNIDVDLTLIIGKDYHSISPIQSYLNY